MELASNVAGLRCDKCWNAVQQLWVGRYGGWVCDVCWAFQFGDWPSARRVPPALEAIHERSLERQTARLDQTPQTRLEPEMRFLQE
jgi:hypothetical protein